jgi:SAM-dependent methyltransferase
MKNAIKSISSFYNKLSISAKLMLFVAIFLIIVMFFNSLDRYKVKEGFTQSDTFLFKKGPELYDEFYADIYDYLVFNNIKNDYEIGEIINTGNPDSRSIILDVGSGTGHHVAKLAERGFNVIGVDISPSMVDKAKENYPDYKFQVGDVMNGSQFKYNSFTHILCLYFTIYYFKDKQQFFQNCMNWLMPGGLLIVHLVNRDKFDPILPPGNPLYIVSPQKYAKERITKTKINFNEFVYNSNFELDKNNNIATFNEKFKFNDGKTRKQEHMFYMEDHNDIVNMATDTGFIIQGIIDLMNAAYEHQYLYVFVKPG